MENPGSTCWTVIRGAASGSGADREEFARRYAPVVRASLTARWSGSPLREEIEDAVQEVFLECFEQGGVLERAKPGRPGGFRAFLFGVIRNVAHRDERREARRRVRPAPEGLDPDRLESADESLSRAFDRAWARSLVRQAAARQAERASAQGEDARRRVELLRLRFYEGMPIRDIAPLWGEDPIRLHREYTRAQEEFEEVLREVFAFHHPEATPGEVARGCESLLGLLEEG